MLTLENNKQPDLTEIQKSIVCTPAELNMLVLAPPGTGKTHTLVHRVVHLVQNQGLAPFSDLLVLSFSRAAVAEIRERIFNMVSSGAHDDLRFLNIRTFDSFSTKLLLSADENIDLSKTSYDDRIQLAVKDLSTKDSPAGSIMKQFRHIIVDEIQDLVGIRAQLVQQVLKNISGGFTLFGDPAQGIFDYLVAQTGIGPTSLEFLSWVKETYEGHLEEKSLDKNFRFRYQSAAISSDARELVIGSQDNGKETYQKLQELVLSLKSAGSVESPDYREFGYMDKSIALLCRTNSDVLFVTSSFMEHGIPCIAPPHKSEQGLPAWLGRVLGQYKSDRISKSAFEDEWRKLIGSDHGPTNNASWKAIKSVEDGEREYLDLNTLRSRLRKSTTWVFDSESYNHSKNILITTIHQSKGREYDNVLILPDQQKNNVLEKDAIEEAKILYVAASRAREKLLRLDRGGTPIPLGIQFPSGKERQSGQNRTGKHLMEVLPDDVDPLSYVHKWLFPKPNLAQTVQDLLWSHLQPGTRLNLMPQSVKGDLKIVLTWINPSTSKPIPIAWLSDQFRDDLRWFLQCLPNGRDAGCKSVMEGVFIFDKTTVVLPPFSEGIHDPWATTGFCVGLGIKGAITID